MSEEYIPYRKTYRGYLIEIVQDNDCESPRDWDNTTTMNCFHRNYNLGDKHDFKDPDDLHKFLCDEAAIYLPLYLYDHSGITISTSPFSCRWDSGQVGYIFMTAEQIKENFAGVSKYCEPCLVGKSLEDIRKFIMNPPNKIWKKLRERMLEVMRNDVKVYDDYIRGNCYGYRISKKVDGKWEETYATWGYIGDYDEKHGCLKDAKADVILQEKSDLPLLAQGGLLTPAV